MYSIVLLKGGDTKRDKVLEALRTAILKDGRFKVHSFVAQPYHTTRAERAMLGEKAYVLPGIFLRGPSGFGGAVRLTKTKPFCGNHPGPCEINPFRGPQKKKNSSTLEWDDWVAFHTLVNRVLNRAKASANVWTKPQDAKGKFWIRKGMMPRVRYDYTEEYGRYAPLRIWNVGTPDQFQVENT